MPRSAKPIPELSEGDVSRLWRMIDQRGPDECWPWKGTKGKPPRDYGAFYVRGSMFRACRVVFSSQDRPVLPEEDVLHSCDYPPCCNPAHLFVGDHKKNMEDCLDKGRGNRAYGEDSGTAKLTDASVMEIRRKYSSGTDCSDLAEEYSVSKTEVRRIVAGKYWTHLPVIEDQPGASDLRKARWIKKISFGRLGEEASLSCSFSGCENKVVAKGLCNSHYRQKQRGKDLSRLRIQSGHSSSSI